MAMTMTQKILARHAGLDKVVPGQLIEASLDLVLGNDITTPPALSVFAATGAGKVFDPEKVALVPDHFTPNKDIQSAEQCKRMRTFAREQNITNYYEQGEPEMGIEHVVLPENGLVAPGDVIIGADSHTCTYGALGAFATGVGSTDMACGMATGTAWFRVPSALRFELVGKPSRWVTGKDIILFLIGKIGVDGALYKSMEFTGPGVAELSMEERLTIANMAIEAGGKNGIFPVDDKTLAYLEKYAPKRLRAGDFRILRADEDAEYDETHVIDLSKVPLTVSFPHLPSNARTLGSFDRIAVDQVVIGSCTNGRIGDMRMARSILKGRRVAKGLRCIVIPGSQKVYLQCVREGIAEDLVEAGAVFSAPTCGPCLGGHMGILANGERCVATTNRNFVGRMGHPGSEVYLAGVPIAAATAIAGYICGPEEIGAEGERQS